MPPTPSDNLPVEPGGTSEKIMFDAQTQADFDKAVNERVAWTLAQREADRAAALAEQTRQAELAAEQLNTPFATPYPETEGKGLYGNQDNEKRYDLRAFGLKALPEDKVTVILPKYNRDGNGNVTGVDLKNSRIQYFDPQAYNNYTSTDKNSGSTPFQGLSVEPIAVHIPR